MHVGIQKVDRLAAVNRIEGSQVRRQPFHRSLDDQVIAIYRVVTKPGHKPIQNRLDRCPLNMVAYAVAMVVRKIHTMVASLFIFALRRNERLG